MNTTEILTGIKNWVVGKLVLKQDVISDLATIRSGAAAGTTAVQPSDLSAYFNDAAYDGNSKRINFYHGQTIVAYIDATAFVIDGMVEDVRIENGYLIIDFNTASGKQDISIPLTDIFDPSNYYTKTQTDTLLAEKEAVANKVTTIDGESTDTQYPSAKVVYDAMQSENADIQAMAKLLVQQQYVIEGLKKMVEGNLGDIRATTINTDDMPMVSGKPPIIVENGAPTVIPYFIGQLHINYSTSPVTIKVCYRVTGSISDWK